MSTLPPRWTLLLGLTLSLSSLVHAQDVDPLVQRANEAVAALTSVEVAADAAREAVSANTRGIQAARDALTMPDSALPLPVEEYGELTLDELRVEHERHEQYLAAIQTREEDVAAGLARIEGHAALVDEWVTREDELRTIAEQAHAALSELREAVLDGTLPADGAALDSEKTDPAEWLAYIQLLDERPGSADAVDAAELDPARQELSEAEVPDPDTQRRQRIESAASATLLGAMEFEEADLVEYLEQDPAVVRTVFDSALEDWQQQARLVSTEREEVAALQEQLADIERQRSELVAPSRDGFEGGEGHAELQAARQDLAFQEAMLGFLTLRLSLIEQSQAAVAALQAATDESRDPVLDIGRRAVNLRSALRALQGFEADGRAALPELGPDDSLGASWAVLKTVVLAAALRDIEMEELAERVSKGEPVRDMERQVDSQVRVLEAARATLEQELSYADVLQEMGQLETETLIVELSADSPLLAERDAAEAEAEELRQTFLIAAERIDGIVGELESLDSPYTQTAVDSQPERAAELEAELIRLSEESYAVQALPRDASDDPGRRDGVRLEVADLFFLPPDVEEEVKPTKAELDLLKREQRRARAHLTYIQRMDELVQRLVEAEAESDEAAAAYDGALARAAQAERRLFAAARELSGRVQRGDVESSSLPEGIDTWLDEGIIEETLSTARGFRDDAEERRAMVQRGLDRYEVFLSWKHWAEVGGEAAHKKVKLIAVPVDHIEAARTPIEALKEFDREDLELQAEETMAAAYPIPDRILSAFVGSTVSDRYEQPLLSYYLELANLSRIQGEYQAARGGFEALVDVDMEHEQMLTSGAIEALEASERVRLLDYQATRYQAAIGVRPSTRVPLAARFRQDFGFNLPSLDTTNDTDVRYWADRLLSAEARLWGDRRWIALLEHRLSRFGFESEISRFRATIEQIDALVEELDAVKQQIRSRIDEVDTNYEKAKNSAALWKLGRIAVIPLVAILIVAFLRKAASRLKQRARADPTMSETDRARRLETLTDVSGKSITVVVWIIAGIYILGQLGLDVTPIIASASVAGLAVAFGAQALVRDYFAGFNILLENQYTIGDVIDLGTAAGTVERITLRMTVLRDLEGVVHYVPNGLVQRVSNKTKGWSRVLLEVSVAYGENIDRVTTILDEIMKGMASEEPWSDSIIEEPQVLGVENMVDSTVSIRLLVKTKPGQQWATARELRARIKRRFDAEGIRAPYQHRVVHHVQVGPDGVEREIGKAPGSHTPVG